MDKKTLVTLAGVLGFLIIMVLAVDSLMGGLPGSVRELYSQEEKGIAQAWDQLDSDQSRVNGLLGSESFLAAISQRESWEDRLVKAGADIDQARTRLEAEAAPLFEKDESESAEQLSLILQDVRSKRVAASREAVTILARAEKLVQYKAKRGEIVAEAGQCFQAVNPDLLSGLKVTAAKAMGDWPEKKADIQERMQVFDTFLSAAADSHAFVVAENKKSDSEIDFDALMSHDEALKQARSGFDASRASLPLLFAQLDVSWDKILEDMEIREGSEVDFYHTYKTIRIDKDNKETVEQTTEKISKDFYLKHEQNLGMTLESKPKGIYDFEVEKQTAPPGYNYVGNSHYGKWQQDSSGRSFWVFYGQYSLMRNLFWGGSYYRPVYRTDYDGYRQARSSGRTYYGKSSTGKSVYGSQGSLSQTKYAGSKYSTSKGFSSSQFKKSGGKYKGSRYVTKKTSSSRSYSSRSSGSRSFGGK